MTAEESILDLLRRAGVMRAGDLVRSLGVSHATLSRVVKRAGERICRIGRGRATQYALSRSVQGIGHEQPVHLVDEAGVTHRHATLHLLGGGQGAGCWLERDRHDEIFSGLPPFAHDMTPQGYVGRGFSERNPDLDLPSRLADWSDVHRLIAIARRGEDCPGNLIVGEESVNRHLASRVAPVRRDAFPELVNTSFEGMPGSSAGGEQPKFAVYSGGRHVIVKFAAGPDAAGERWRDLLESERLALEVLRAAGMPASVAACFDAGGMRFLEVDRFDRLGDRGRRPVISLLAINNEYYGDLSTWAQAAAALRRDGRLDDDNARELRWLDAFGQLIGNTDRHLGNVSFFGAGRGPLRLTPVYDMLPMRFAPAGTTIVDRPYVLPSPTAATLDVWPGAARWAIAYWGRVADSPNVSRAFRDTCLRCLDDLRTFVGAFPHLNVRDR